MNQVLVTVLCTGIIAFGSICLAYFIYSLVLIDAKARGITKPKFWSLIAASGQRGEGLILYLLKRKGLSALLNQADKQKMTTIKRKIYCSMVIVLSAFILMVVLLIGYG